MYKRWPIRFKHNKQFLSQFISISNSNLPMSSPTSHPFVQYTTRLGYPTSLAQDALSRLGDNAKTNDLLATVIANANRSNIRPVCNSGSSYLLSQDCFRRSDESSKNPVWGSKR